MMLAVKNWAEFQHYKDRSPPWIKLHHKILDDFEFHSLPVDSRALAPCLWLIASEEKDGVFDATYEKLAFRLRQTAEQIEKALTPLIDRGFLILVIPDSNPLADRKQVAVPETEAEREGETERDAVARRRPKVRCPEQFDVDEAMATWAESKGLPSDRIITETEKFLAHHRSKDSLFKDWNQAWQSWIFKAVDFGARRST